MAESTVQVTEGSGKKLHTFQRTIGGNNVEDEVIIQGEPYLPSYIAFGLATSLATANSHQLQIMAGSTLNVRIRRISMFPAGLPAAASLASIELFRVSTAGTGGGAVTVNPYDTADPSAGATAMTLPTSKGTEGSAIQIWRIPFPSAQPVTSPPTVWQELPFVKPIIIPAGTSNGIVFKSLSAIASATLDILVEFSESSF